MQLISNLRNFRTLRIPSSAMTVLEMVDVISNYKVVDDDWFQNWLQRSVLPVNPEASKIIRNSGEILLVLAILTALALLWCFLYCICGSKSKVVKYI